VTDNPQHLDQYRLLAVEAAASELRKDAVSQKWLDERLGRIEDAVTAAAAADAVARRAMTADIAEMKASDKNRRNAVYLAVLGALLSLAIATITA
jgi:hypothetical protein